jgi:heme-degrading monooxygenase HmoA
MYIAMNRFRIVEGREAVFEETWQNRNRYVQDVEGFVDFKLLRGETEDGVTPYVSHSTWASREAFVAWTQGEAFQKAHQDARSPAGTLAGPPAFSGWDVVLED